MIQVSTMQKITALTNTINSKPKRGLAALFSFSMVFLKLFCAQPGQARILHRRGRQCAIDAATLAIVTTAGIGDCGRLSGKMQHELTLNKNQRRDAALKSRSSICTGCLNTVQ